MANQTIINGNVYGEPNQEIIITPVYDSGIKIADITINGVDYPLYIPDQNSQNGGNNS